MHSSFWCQGSDERFLEGKNNCKVQTIVCVEGQVQVLSGVSGRCHLHGCRGGEHQDVGAGRVLGRVQLRRLHVQSGAAPEHGARGHRICARQIQHSLSFAKPEL